MCIFPKVKRTVEVNKTKDQIIDLLKRESQISDVSPLFFEKSKKQFFAEFYQDKILFTIVTDYKNNFKPIIEIKIEEVSERKSKIFITAFIHIGVKITFVVISIIASLFSYLLFSSSHSQNESNLLPLVIIVFFWIIIQIGFKMDLYRSFDTLKKILSKQIIQ